MVNVHIVSEPEPQKSKSQPERSLYEKLSSAINDVSTDTPQNIESRHVRLPQQSPSPQEQLQKRLDALPSSHKAYNQLIEEYKNRPQLLSSIVSHAKTKLSPAARLEIFIPLLSSGEYNRLSTYDNSSLFSFLVEPSSTFSSQVSSALDHQLIEESRTAFQEMPDSEEKLQSLLSASQYVKSRQSQFSEELSTQATNLAGKLALSQLSNPVQKLQSLVNIAQSVKSHQPQFSEELSTQAIELASNLAATSVSQGAYSKAHDIVNILDSKEARDIACQKIISQLPTRLAVQGVLSLTDDQKLQFELLNQIKQKALETGDFNDANTSTEFISTFLALPDVKPSIQQVEDVFTSIKSPYTRIQVCTSLVNTIKNKALRHKLFNKIDTTYQQIPDSETKLQSLINVATSFKKSQPEYSAKLADQAIRTAIVVVANTDIELATKAIDVFKSSNERMKVRMEAVLRLKKGPKSLRLLSDAIVESSTIEELRLIKARARESENFSDVSLMVKYISKLPELEKDQIAIEEMEKEVGDVLSSESPTMKVEILFEVLRQVKKSDFARYLAQQSLEVICQADFDQKDKPANLSQLTLLCKEQHLFGDQDFSQALTLNLIEEEQFKNAKMVLAENKAIAKDIALATSEKTPGFALYALEQAIEQDKDLIYSEIHSQTLALAAKQIAKYSPEMAKRALNHAVELTHNLAIDAKVEPQKRREFYRQISLPPNGGNGHAKGNGAGGPIAIQVTLEAEFNSFVTEKENLFIEELADMLRISPDDILILNKWEGSTVYKLGFEIEWAGLIFKFKFEKQDKDIFNFELIIKTRIVSVEIVRTTEGEKAEARRNKGQPQSLEARANNVLEIQLAENTDINTAAVYVTKSPIGYREGAAIKLPFTNTQFKAILKALEQMAKPSEPTGNESPENYISKENGNWKPSQIEALNEQGLISKNGIKLVTGMWRKILLYFCRRLLHGEMRPLFQRSRWWLILKVVFQPNIQHFNSSQIKMLCEMELINGASLDPGYFLKRIGGVIYESLTSNEDINYVLRSSIEQVKDLAFRLEVNKNALHLARYPWELINKRDYFLLDKLNLDLARSISGGPARSLKVSSPLKILYVESRPGPNSLPRDEFKVVKAAFQNLGSVEEESDDILRIVIEDTGLDVELKTIWSPTYNGLIDHLNENDYHILHFDGHGQFGRQCPNCGKLHHVPEPTCLRCRESVLEIPLGFLQFENDQRRPDWISSEEFYYLLARKSLRLVVLSACLSGKTYDETVFAGTAQALLKSAIPAVVAMQFQIGTTDACEFLQSFYSELAKTGNVRQAIQAGRQKLKRQPSWYVPALYLRGEDVLGQLFTIPVLERTQL